jgi:hypothetical protein
LVTNARGGTTLPLATFREFYTNFREQRAYLRLGIHGVAFPSRADAKIREKPGGVFVEMKERGRSEVKDPLLLFTQRVVVPNLGEQALNPVKSGLGCVLHMSTL